MHVYMCVCLYMCVHVCARRRRTAANDVKYSEAIRRAVLLPMDSCAQTKESMQQGLDAMNMV